MPRSPKRATAGCSGTPLARKLGVDAASTLVALGAPPEYEEWLAPLPRGARIERRAGLVPGPAAGEAAPRAVHLFTTRRTELAVALAAWRSRLDDSGYLWISWPKRSSKVPTDVTEDTIRELALPLGFVDVKVCAVSEVWSGLKLVVRKELRRK